MLPYAKISMSITKLRLMLGNHQLMSIPVDSSINSSFTEKKPHLPKKDLS